MKRITLAAVMLSVAVWSCADEPVKVSTELPPPAIKIDGMKMTAAVPIPVTISPTISFSPIPTRSITTIPTDIPSREILQALSKHLSSTVCIPSTSASDPIPEWCGRVTGTSVLGDTLTMRTTLAPSQRSDLLTMCRALSSFVFNNLYTKYGLKNIVVVSDSNGAILVSRRGLENSCQ